MSGEAEALVFLLETLKEEWKEYKNLKDGARNELAKLKLAHGQLEAFLKNTAMMPESLLEKESEIRDLVYEMEDTIDICLTKSLVAETKNIFSQFWRKLGTKMEREVKYLNQQKVKPLLDEIQKKSEATTNNNHGSSSRLPKPITEVEILDQSADQESSPDLSNSQEKIVEFPKEASVIGFLKESKEELDIIAITGMAGLGKTTFARKIFEHKDIVAKFPLRIWIHVSQKFNSTDAFRYILKEITRKETHRTNDRDLIKSVLGSLATKEFLLVMDDVWTEQDWNEIKEILPMKNGKGKVLLTTRHDDIANNAAHIMRPPHKLDTLESMEGLKLLKLQVFGNPKHCPERLEKVGKIIAEKCGGVPLIILVIGGILKGIVATYRGVSTIKDEWEDVSKNVNKFLQQDKQNLIKHALEMSYKRLDPELRVCFLYTGLFPEKHVIPVSTLTQLWIAEGFIQRKAGQSLEENAEIILDTLIKMNLLEVEKKNLKHVKTCRVHDMIREFCRTKATNEKLFRVIKTLNGGPDTLEDEVSDFRRLCFDSDPSAFPPKDLRDSRVRSLLCFYEKSKSSNHGPVTLPDVNNFLRVLNCRSTKLQQFPDVKNLILLKHITLFIENLKVLPEDIAQLVNLQTLIVDTNLDSITVKVNIWKMIRLRRLKTKAAIVLDGKNWKGKSRGNLQTVSRLSPQSCKTGLSERAPYLKKLGVRGILTNLVENMSVEDFPNLEKLKLINDSFDKSAPSCPLALTKAACFPRNLKSLTLSKTYLQWDLHMTFLAKIENLKVLKLKDNAFTGDKWDASKAYFQGDEDNDAVGFPKLRFLLIEKLGLVEWDASDAYFHGGLSSLVIKNCDQLQKIPESLAGNLESLDIHHVNKSVYDSAKKIEAERQTKQNQISNWEVPFKLTIGPGCDQFLFSGTIKANTSA